MKLFIVGSDKIYAIENYYVKHLKVSGVEVFHFPAQTIFYDYYLKSILNKIIYKFNLSNITKKINNEFRKEVIKFKPDVIWIFKGMEIFPESIEWAKGKGIAFVNYNPDNPFIFSGKGSGNLNVRNSIHLYDLHLTYNNTVKNEISNKYKISTRILPFGFDLSDEVFKECCLEMEIMKTCFLGNPDIHRSSFLLKLAEQGIKIDIYGSNWNKFLKHPNIKIFMPVFGTEVWKTLRKYRVQLNLMRLHNPDSHNMRSFEIPGVGGIQLAPNTDDHRMYFEPNKEIFLFENVEECKTKILLLLNLPLEEAKEIRFNSRKRSLISEYSYQHRSEQALSYINAIYE